MSKKILLISENQIKQQSVIEKNVDGKILSKTILSVQEIELKGILGSTLYNSLLDSVELYVQSGTTMSTGHRELLNEYVQPYLIHEVVSNFIIVNNYKITNKGLLKMRDDLGQNASPEDLNFIKTYYSNLVSRYKSALISYIADNDLKTSCDTDNNQSTISNTGWYLK